MPPLKLISIFCKILFVMCWWCCKYCLLVKTKCASKRIRWKFFYRFLVFQGSNFLNQLRYLIFFWSVSEIPFVICLLFSEIFSLKNVVFCFSQKVKWLDYINFFSKKFSFQIVYSKEKKRRLHGQNYLYGIDKLSVWDYR